MGENTNIDAKSRGWVKLWRTLFDNPRARDPEWLAVWIDFLLNATHTAYEATFQGKLITLRPGQLITGRFAQAERTGVHESKVRRIWGVMKSDHQIDQQAGNKNSLFTILNWHLYQGIDQQNGQQVAINRPTTDQQPTTNKNVEKEKNEKKGEARQPFKSELRKQIEELRNIYSRIDLNDTGQLDAVYAKLIEKEKQYLEVDVPQTPERKPWGNDPRLIDLRNQIAEARRELESADDAQKQRAERKLENLRWEERNRVEELKSHDQSLCARIREGTAKPPKAQAA